MNIERQADVNSFKVILHPADAPVAVNLFVVLFISSVLSSLDMELLNKIGGRTSTKQG